MPRRLTDKIADLGIEEKILNAAAIIAIVGMFFPWVTGEWLDESRYHLAFGFHTGFIGLAVFVLQIFIVSVTLVPLVTGRSLLRKQYRDYVRFQCAFLSSLLVIAALSVIVQATATDFQLMDVGFGIYITLISGLVVTLYAYLQHQEYKRSQAQEVFYHPEQTSIPKERERDFNIDPPPRRVPSPPAAEEHRIHS